MLGTTAVEKKRPTNLDISSILSYQLPLPGLVSITHRISGLILFLAIPILLCALDKSLESEMQFAMLQDAFDGFFMFLVMWGILSAIIFHMVAGIKHLIMDMGYGESIEGARLGSKIVIGVTGVLVIIVGVWLW